MELTPEHVTICPYCDSTSLRPWVDRVKDRLRHCAGEYSFLRCGECGAAILSPRPCEADIGRTYPPEYTFNTSQEAASKTLGQIIQERCFYEPIFAYSAAMVKRHTGLRTGRLLEVGSGSGGRLAVLKRAGWEVEGLEIDERAASRTRASLGVPVHTGLLEDRSLPPGVFDVVMSVAVVEHLVDPLRTCREMIRLLKPGGWLVIDVPMVDGLQHRFLGRRWQPFTEAPRHLTLPSGRGITSLLARCEGVDLKLRTAGSALVNAGIAAMTVFPLAAATFCQSSERPRSSTIQRVLAAFATVAYLPLAYAEQLLGRPATMIFFAQKAV